MTKALTHDKVDDGIEYGMHEWKHKQWYLGPVETRLKNKYYLWGSYSFSLDMVSNKPVYQIIIFITYRILECAYLHQYLEDESWTPTEEKEYNHANKHLDDLKLCWYTIRISSLVIINKTKIIWMILKYLSFMTHLRPALANIICFLRIIIYILFCMLLNCSIWTFEGTGMRERFEVSSSN